MTSAGGHSRLVAVFYQTALWLGVLLALGATPSAANAFEGQPPRFHVERLLSSGDSSGNDKARHVCSTSSALPADDDVSPPRFVEPVDTFWVEHAEARRPVTILVLAFCSRDHLVRDRPDTGGRHARGPPEGFPAV